MYAREYLTTYCWCVKCRAHGRKVLAEQVDHITPISGPTDRLFWEPSNHQPLCGSCHSRKTVVEDKLGIGHGRTP